MNSVLDYFSKLSTEELEKVQDDVLDEMHDDDLLLSDDVSDYAPYSNGITLMELEKISSNIPIVN
jgi:hypothetical protein